MSHYHSGAHYATLQHTATGVQQRPHSVVQDSLNVMQHTTPHCNTLLHHATQYTTLQHTATGVQQLVGSRYISINVYTHMCIYIYTYIHIDICIYTYIYTCNVYGRESRYLTQRATPHCNTLHRTATPYTTLQRVCNKLHSTATHYTTPHCNTLHHTAMHFLTLQQVRHTLQHTATHCNTLQQVRNRQCGAGVATCQVTHHTTPYCNILQHTATSVQQTAWGRSRHMSRHATHNTSLQHTAAHCNTLQHTAAHCNTLQHIAKHCNTLQQVRNSVG